MKFSKQNYLLLSLAILLGLFFHYDSLFEYPMFIHAWAQADRYALALNFLWNDFNFLEAETYLHNIEFPMSFTEPKEDSVTMVNFPIHEYFIAILMKLTGITAPVLFRFYIFCTSIVGLFYLIKLSQLFKLSIKNQILVLIFAASSPVFIYYQDNFLPSIPSFSITLMGIYHYLVYLRKPQLKLLALSIFLLTISSLYRTTFIIPQIAILSVELIRVVRKKSNLKWFVSLLFLSALSLYFHKQHNEHQIHQYGSIFLYYIVPALSWSEAIEHISLTYRNWHFDYLNQVQLVLFTALLIFGIKNLKQFKPNNDFRLSVLLFLGAMLCGYVLFTIAMLSKFPQHDYYFIDTYFTPTLIILILLLTQLEKTSVKLIESKWYLTVLILFGLSSVFLGFKNHKERRIDTAWDYSSELVDIYACGDQILDSLNISQDAKLMVFGPQYPNLPLLLFNRKGYTLFWKNDWEIDRALTWDFDYIILPNQYFLKEYYSFYPELINRFKKVYDNGKFSICELKETQSTTSLIDFFQLKDEDIVFNIQENFENNQTNYLEVRHYSDDYAIKGNSSSLTEGDQVFALGYSNDSLPFMEDYPTKLRINSNFLVRDTLKRVEFVVSIQDKKGNNQFYETFHLNKIYNGPDKWHSFELIYQFPRLVKGEYILKIYYWNRDKSQFYIDDVSYTFYR